ncbi:hypothetical protein LINPERPRIM_LOCUS14770, partial [Linum perenne]
QRRPKPGQNKKEVISNERGVNKSGETKIKIRTSMEKRS